MVKFGLLLNFLQTSMPRLNINYEREAELLAKVAVEADRLGFYSVGMLDHLELDVFEALTALSYVAALTKNVKITQNVVNPNLRNPALFAKMAATIDRLSKGRLELGIGTGTPRNESYEPYGMPTQPHRARIDRLVEFLDVLNGLWKGGPLNYDGKYYKLKGAAIEPTPAQLPRPRIMIGGLSRGVMRIATDYEVWNFWLHPMQNPVSPSICREKIREFRKICEEKGKSPEGIDVCVSSLIFFVSEDKQKVRDVVKEQARRAGLDPDWLEDRLKFAFVGTPEDVAKKVEAFVDAGVNYFLLNGLNRADPQSLEIFAKDIMKKYS